MREIYYTICAGRNASDAFKQAKLRVRFEDSNVKKIINLNDFRLFNSETDAELDLNKAIEKAKDIANEPGYEYSPWIAGALKIKPIVKADGKMIENFLFFGSDN